MAAFNVFIDCDNNSLESISVTDILQHPQSPFAELSVTQLNEYNAYYPTGNKKEIIVRTKEPAANCPYEHYEALCCFGLIQKQRLLGEDTCQCCVKRDLSDNDALVEMLSYTLKQCEFISLIEKAKAYNLLFQVASNEAYSIVGECEASFHKTRSLTQLIPPLIAFIEAKRLSVQTATQIKSLDKSTQNVIYNYLLACNKKLTLPIAVALNRYATEIGEITPSTLTTIFGDTG